MNVIPPWVKITVSRKFHESICRTLGKNLLTSNVLWTFDGTDSYNKRPMKVATVGNNKALQNTLVAHIVSTNDGTPE